MRRRVAILLGAGLLGALAGLVAHLPAGHAVAMMAPADIAARGVAGTVWRGSARRVDYGGPVAITALRWRVSALGLLTGTLAVDAGFDVAGGHADADVTVARGDGIRIRDATFRGAAAGMAPLLPALAVALEGEVIARIDGGRWTGERPADVQARILWERARIRAPASVALGDVVAEIRPRPDGGHRMTVENRDGALAVDGGGDADADGRYRLQLRLRPGPEVSAEVLEFLRAHAERDNGAFVVRDSGRLVFR